jgi:hypothetical protein
VLRKIFWALLIIPGLTGCPRDEKDGPKAERLPFAGQEVRLAVPASLGFRTLWEGPLNEWAAQSGARYSLTEYTPSDDTSPFAADHESTHTTLAVFPLERSGEIIVAGELAAIPRSVIDAGEAAIQWHDLFAGLREKLASRRAAPMLVPLSAPVLVCYLRQDLLDAAGLAAPNTWDEYQQLLDKLENWAPGCTAVEPWSDEFRATMFLSRAASLAQHPGQYSLYFDIESGQPLIDGPAFVRALDTARSALQKMPVEVRNYDPGDCRRELMQGRAAMAIAYETPAAASTSGGETAADRSRRMEIGFVRLPGSREVYNSDRRLWEPLADKSIHRVTLTAFSGWAVGASARNSLEQTEVGWNALVKVCGSDFTSGFPMGFVGLCRESHLQNASLVDSGLAGRETISYSNALAQSLRDLHLVAELPVIGRTAFRQSLARALAAAIEGSATSEQALESAARDWREIIGRLGEAKVRDSYRSSLGLSPKLARN